MDSNIEVFLNSDRPIINFVFSGKPVEVDLFFSMNRLQSFLDNYGKGGDYRGAFSLIAFDMYLKTPKSNNAVLALEKKDFVEATDDELIALMTYILKSDEHLLRQYEVINCDNAFERFYLANEKMFKDMVAPLSKTMKQFEKIAKSIQLPHLSALQKIADQQSAFMHTIKVPQIDALNNLSSALQLQSDSLTRMTEAFHFESIADTLNFNYSSPILKFDYPEINSVLKNIPPLNFDMAAIMLPFSQQVAEMQFSLTTQLEAAILEFTRPLASLDFSMLTYHNEWSQKHDTLVKFGWFYLNELPEDIIDAIYDQRDEIKAKQVDAIIVQYFRQNRCLALKQVVKKWDASVYFKTRGHIFHEALVNHSQRRFNSSTTLLALHTEGIITDFVRIKFQNPRFNAEKAISDITDHIDNIPMNILNFSDWKIYSSVLERILFAFTEQFKLANPDAASNNSRHKIAHGHAVEIENEVNSLKRFLYLNEVYRLFSLLEEKTQ